MRGLLRSARRKAQGAIGFKKQEFGPGRRLAAKRKTQGARRKAQGARSWLEHCRRFAARRKAQGAPRCKTHESSTYVLIRSMLRIIYLMHIILRILHTHE